MAMDLPPDVVRKIFDDFAMPMTVCKPELFPWFLGHICSEWRNVFLSMTGQFWGNLVVKFLEIGPYGSFPSSVECYERALDILKLCLEYSAGHPLSVSFVMRDSYYAEEHIYVIDILDAVIGQSMRWRKVYLHLQDSEIQRLHRIKGHTPLLESITLTRINDPYWSWGAGKPVDERFADTFSDSPRLTRLRISSIDTWKFTWSSILALELLVVDIESLLTVLPQATHLEELEVGVVNDRTKHISDRMITLPSVKKLVFLGLSMLSVLVAPNLVHLSLTSDESSFSGNDPSETSIVPFIRRSACPLEHLELLHVKPATTAEVLLLVPSLIHLHLKSVDSKPLTAKNEILGVPRLKSLEISSSRMLPRQWVDEMGAIVASRARDPEVDGLQELVMVTGRYQSDVVDMTSLQAKCDEHNIKLTVRQASD